MHLSIQKINLKKCKIILTPSTIMKNDLINILNVINRTVRYSESYEIWVAHEWDLSEESAASIAEEYERRAKKNGWPF